MRERNHLGVVACQQVFDVSDVIEESSGNTQEDDDGTDCLDAVAEWFQLGGR